MQANAPTIYERLFGIKPLINLCGGWSYTGGSRPPPEALEAFLEASRHFVDFDELLKRSGEVIAKLLGVEAAYITSGASAAVTLMTSACMTGTDIRKIEQLPDTTGMKNEVIIQRGHIPYSFMVRWPGAKIVWVGASRLLTVYPRTLGTLPEDIEEAITKNTCAIFTLQSDNCPPIGLVPVEEVSKIAHKQGIPVITDAADMLPPISNLHNLLKAGSDLVCFSGWKSLQCFWNTGIIVGNKELVEACRLNAKIVRAAIGRGYKVNKEAIAALVVTVQNYLNRDWDSFHAKEKTRAEYVINNLKGIPCIRDAELLYPDESGVQRYRVLISLDEDALGMTAVDVAKMLRTGDPPIAINTNYLLSGKLCIETWIHNDNEPWEDIFVERLNSIIHKKTAEI